MAGWFKNKVDLESIDRGWPRWVRGLTAKITKTFQQLSSKGERAGNNLAQKYLNALHAANLLLQKDTTSYKIILMTDDASPDLALCTHSLPSPSFPSSPQA